MAMLGDKQPEDQTSEAAKAGSEKPARPAQVMPASAQGRKSVV